MTDVVVIGGGFSGAMTAAHLVAAGVATIVIEPGELGRGRAYSAPPGMLLNVPVAGMSALPDRPAHFADWLRDPAVRFAPRRTYGDYLADAIAELSHGWIDHVRARAIDVERAGRGYVVACDDGRRYGCRAVVLALGNAPPRPVARGELDPYGPLPDTLALIGTGLTALDVVATSPARRIVMVSRRGLVPIAHAPVHDKVALPRELLHAPRLAALLAWWRDSGAEPIAMVDALRPQLQLIWRRLPVADRACFLRHVRPHWDVVRHRAPPQVRARFDELRASGVVEVIRGRAVASERGRVVLATASGVVHRDVDAIVNCTGPERDVARMGALPQALLARGLVARDPLGLGATAAAPDVHVVGPWRAGELWETTAVPELRVQAARTAEDIAGALRANARILHVT